jgi:exodeoxyribonuclease V gamma subunit
VLHIHRAERADRLVDALACVVAAPLVDPLTPEVVAVPTRGVERWLIQCLSSCLGVTPGRRDGVCANIEFPFPGRLVGGAVALASGVDRDADPWLPERAVWPLLDVVDEHLGEPWLASLTAHLGGTGPGADLARRARRFGAVRHLADLYDRYGVHRPEMLRAWAAGDDTDALGTSLPDDVAWQARLWRCLLERIGSPSPPQRLRPACARLRDDPLLAGLPTRVSLFGLTRLPGSYLEVLDALASGRDVHLFLLHPSPVLWQQVAGVARDASAPRRRSEDRTAALPRNPLLASWGRDAREMELVVTASGGTPVDDHRAVTLAATTLLRRIQSDIQANAAPPGVPLPGRPDRRATLQPDDRSLQVHACHGRARQVEVLRDAVLHLLATDGTLEPRDIIVMCPDIETFAPLIHATFGAGEDGAPQDDQPAASGARPSGLRVRLADRSLRQTNPVLRVVSELLALADARLTSSQVLDLASREPVRRRFGFHDQDLERLEDWVPAAGIRWGIDAAHRAPFKLDALEGNTWRAGLNRILLGVAMAEEGHRLVGDVLPLDDVTSGDIDLAGRLAELVDRLAAALAGLRGPQSIAVWAQAIASAADALTATGEARAWQRTQLQRILDDVLGEATVDSAVSAAPLALPEVRALFADRLRGRPTRPNFRTGHLTICTLVPMRSVPHRVVCLLGLDDGTFPRRTARDGDDLIDRDPHVGDRDLRSEDRQLLLDALLAATEHLVVTYAGRDERTNVDLPPAVPLGELLDVVDRTVSTDETDEGGAEIPARRRILFHHPLQPFDPRNFTAGALVRAGPWSFDAVALDGARALAAGAGQHERFLGRPLPEDDTRVIELDDLVRFVQHPVRAFLRRRLGVTLAGRNDEPSDALPVELDALAKWGVGQRLLEARLAGVGQPACAAAERARGMLPPGQLGQRVLDDVGPEVDRLVVVARDVSDTGIQAESIEVTVLLDDGRTLVGTVQGVIGERLRTVTYSRVGAKHRLAAWVRLLAATAAHPGRPYSAVTVGRRSGGGVGVTVAEIPCLDQDPQRRQMLARRHLAVLVDLYRRGMREPLPLFCDTSAAYAQALAEDRDPQSAARKAWESEWDRDREDRDPEHRLVLRGAVPFARLLEASLNDDEAGRGWAPDEATRFGRYAVRLWEGLLSREEVRRR